MANTAGRRFLSGMAISPAGRREPAHRSTPEGLFEYDWAVTLLNRALQKLRAEYPDSEFLRMKPFLLGEAAHGDLAAAARRRLSQCETASLPISTVQNRC